MDTINLGIYKNNRFKWIARLEILFWRNFIWILKTMKISRVIFISGLFLVASLALVAFFTQSSRDVYSNLSHQAPKDLTSGQRNTLLLVVDDGFETKPQLRSIWLLLELPDKPSFTLIPLYPAAVKNHAIHDLVLEDSFAINEKGNLDESFLAQLDELNIWWNDFILIDDYILGSLFELTNGSSIAGKPVTGADIRSGNYPSVESKSDQLKVQVELLQYFCQKISLAPLHPNYQNTIASFSSHAITSLENEDLVTRLALLNQLSNKVNCNFPTLNAIKATDSKQDLN